MFCKDCGAKIYSWQEFCNRCGAALYNKEHTSTSDRHSMMIRVFNKMNRPK